LSKAELDIPREGGSESVTIGAGFKGMMNLTPKAKEMLSDYEHHVLPTDAAVQMIRAERRWFVAIMPLPC
jgi:hypothetical protein